MVRIEYYRISSFPVRLGVLTHGHMWRQYVLRSTSKVHLTAPAPALAVFWNT
jgi:hypothetical protein